MSKQYKRKPWDPWNPDARDLRRVDRQITAAETMGEAAYYAELLEFRLYLSKGKP